jgi:hypothetical protein
MQWGRKRESNWGSYYFLFEKKTVKRFVQCHVFTQSSPGWYCNDKYSVNTSPCSRFVEKCSHAVLFGRNNNSYTISMQSHMCEYTYILHNIEMHVWQKEQQKIMTAVNAVHQGNLSACHFWHMCHRFASHASLSSHVKSWLYDYNKLVPLHKK